MKKLIRKNLLFLQIISQRDAGSHYAGELGVVHDAGAGVSSHVFFQEFFAYQADAGGYAGKGCSFHDSLHELVLGYSYIKKIFFQLKKSCHLFITITFFKLLIFFTTFAYVNKTIETFSLSQKIACELM